MTWLWDDAIMILKWEENKSKPDKGKLPWFWRGGGGGSVKPLYGFGYWCSGPETKVPLDGLLTYHNLQGKPELERETDLVKLQPTRLRAFIEWTKVMIVDGERGYINES